MIADSRLRIRFSKLGKIRFIGHRDLARIWERSMHQARVPIAYSLGFTPHPKISFGLALPVGWESTAEYLDLVLTVEMDQLASEVNSALPDGIRIEETAVLPGKGRSLSSVVSQARYSVWIAPAESGVEYGEFAEELKKSLEQLLNTSQAVVSRSKKGEEIEEDIRPLIADLAVSGAGDEERSRYGVRVHMTLATQPRVLRPEEVATAISSGGLTCEASLVRRESQHVFVGGIPVDPMHQSALGLAGAA